jgi:hypothetical protein
MAAPAVAVLLAPFSQGKLVVDTAVDWGARDGKTRAEATGGPDFHTALGWAAVKAGTVTADNPNTAMAVATTAASAQGRARLRRRPGKPRFLLADAPVP